MARYYDLDSLRVSDINVGTVMFPRMERCILLKDIESAPTADVAPKSEVAREIIDEFMSAMRVKHEENRPKYGGALALLLPDIEQIAAELKKKYTGEQT